jgi:hypothetical protein
LFILFEKAHVVEQEELRLRAEIGHIADTGRLEVGLGQLGGAARVAIVGFAGVGLDDRAMQADRLFRVERIDIGALGVGHELHVRGFDALPARDRGAVEHEAFVKEVLVDQIGHHRDVLQLAARIGEADVDIGRILVLDHFKYVFFAHRDLPLTIWSDLAGRGPPGLMECRQLRGRALRARLRRTRASGCGLPR